MSNELAEEKYYSPTSLEGLADCNRTVKDFRDNIERRLVSYKEGDKSALTEKRVVLEYFRDQKVSDQEKKELSVDIVGLWGTVGSQIHRVDELRQGHESFMELKIKDERKFRAAERTDKWLLWRDQLGRWVVGTVLAILFYSGVVYFSDDHCVADDGKSSRFCIRVPIKDWIPH